MSPDFFWFWSFSVWIFIIFHTCNIRWTHNKHDIRILKSKKRSRVTVFCFKSQLTSFFFQPLIHVLSPKFVSSFLFSLTHITTCPSRHHPPPHPLPESCQQSLHLLPFLWNIYDSWCLNQELASVFPVIMGKTRPVTLPRFVTCARSPTCALIYSHTHTQTQSNT